MMFPTFALLSGIALFASGAAAVTTYQISVSNDSAALLFDPSYIVRQPIFLYTDRCADGLSLSLFSDCRSGRYRRVYLPSQEPLCDPIKLSRTMHALGGRIRYWLVRPQTSHTACFFLFSDASPHHTATLLQMGQVTPPSPHGNSLSTTYVCSLAKYGSYQELAILIFLFLFF